MQKKLKLVFILLVFVGCSDTKPFLREGHSVKFGRYDERPNHADVLTFYALGDWGTGNKNQRAVAEALKNNVAELPRGREVAPFVLGLGDNVYEHGLPVGWNNPVATELLHKTFGDMYSNIEYEGENLIFHIVPGNHDYAGKAGREKNGFGDIIHQETTAEKLYAYWKYYPIDPEKNSNTEDSTNYCALKDEDIFSLAIPEKIPVGANNKLAIFAIDTQVLLDSYVKNDSQILNKHWQKLEALLQQSNAEWKIIIGHNPIKSHGKHGGFRTAIWWVPPVLLVTIVDKLFVKPLQDMDNPENKRLQKDLRDVMKKHNVAFYLAGHEHSLQFLEIDEGQFQIISGSAGKLSPVTHKSDTFFSHESFGFARFDLAPNEMWVEFFGVDPGSGSYSSSGLFRISK